jgi:excinuclease ABC subunit A
MNSKIKVSNGVVNNLKKINVSFEQGHYYVLAGPSGSGKSSLAFDILYAEALRQNKAKGVEKIFRHNQRLYKVENLPALTVGIEQQSNPQSRICSVGWYSGFIKEIIQSDSYWCSNCKGHGYIRSIDPERVVRNPLKPLIRGAFTPGVKESAHFTADLWKKICKTHKTDYETPFNQLPKDVQKILLYGNKSDFNGFIPPLAALIYTKKKTKFIDEEFLYYLNKVSCPDCKGTGLFKSYSSIIENRTIENMVKANKLKMTTQEKKWLSNLELCNLKLNDPIFGLSSSQVRRLRFFCSIRGIPANSLIIFDEPCVGLLPLESLKMINVFIELAKSGHTVLVVEHSSEAIKAADEIIAFGPCSGLHGGRIVFQGYPDEYLKEFHKKISFGKTCKKDKISKKKIHYKENKQVLSAGFKNWYGFNSFNVEIPLIKLVCVSGPSGSGKSAFLEAVFAACDKTPAAWQGKIKIRDSSGQDYIRRPHRIDSSPIENKSSTPATFLGFWKNIREIFAELKESKKQSFTESFFSFNTKQGKCKVCSGQGLLKEDKLCPECKGTRYNKKVLTIKYNGKNIADVNKMTVEEALILFKNESKVSRYLNFLSFTALDYLVLGQPSYSLSGGELQRIKIASQLGKKLGDRSIYILDIPSRGLDSQMLPKLYSSLKDLVQKNNTVLIAENNPEIAGRSDWLIILGMPQNTKVNLRYSGKTEECHAEIWSEFMGKFPSPKKLSE